MKEKTRLITIEYDEYIELKFISNNVEKAKLTELISEFKNFIEQLNLLNFDKEDLIKLCKAVIQQSELRLEKIKKEGENNEL